MAKPITWRNIAGPNFGGTSSPSSAFAAAGKGFATLNEQLRERETLEDQRRTNEAISAALSGGPRTSGDRRVDAEALRSSVASQDLTASRLTGEGLAQELTGVQTDQAEVELEAFPKAEAARLAESAAKTDAALARTAESRANVASLAKSDRERDESNARMKGVEQRWAAIASDDEAAQLGQKEEALGLLRENNPGITDAEVEEIWSTSMAPQMQARAQADRESQLLTFEADELAKGDLSRAEWEATTPGGRSVSGRAFADERASKRRSVAQEQETWERKAAGEAAKGKFENLVPTSSGFRVVGDKQEADRNSISITQNAAVNQAASGNRLELTSTKDKGKAFEVLQMVGGNKAVYDDVMRAGVTSDWHIVGGPTNEVTDNGWKKIFKAARTMKRGLEAAGTKLQKEQVQRAASLNSMTEMVRGLTEERKDRIWKASPEGQAAIAEEQRIREEEAKADEVFDYAALYGGGG